MTLGYTEITKRSLGIPVKASTGNPKRLPCACFQNEDAFSDSRGV